MINKEGYDVIVVGAGPAGLTAANYATKYGARVLLLERCKTRPNPVRCAEGLPINNFNKYDIIPSDCICCEIDKLTLHAPDGRAVSLRNKRKGLILDRGKYEEFLLQRAIRKGVTYASGTIVRDLIIEDGVVRGVLAQTESGQRRISCSIMIAADGIESQIARKAGIDTMLSKADLVSCYQYRIRHESIDAESIHIFVGKCIAPGAYAWVFPKSRGEANVGLGMNVSLRGDISPKELCKQFIADSFPGAKVISETGGAVPVAPSLSRLSAPGLLIVGDAARLVNPLTGGGIDAAIYSGKVAGMTAAKAIVNKDDSYTYLKKYDKRINTEIGLFLKLMYSLNLRSIRMSDERANRIVQMLSELPEGRRSTRSFIYYLLRKQPLSILKVIRSGIMS